jgi:Uma2 family endonuclease
MRRLILALSDEFKIDVESAGATTLRLEIKAKGAEPDDSFYVQNAALVAEKEDDLDLEKDPPPDLAIEVERTSASLKKLPIYAAMRVPEIWRIEKKSVRIYLLSGDNYSESTTSLAFPFLSAKTLSEFLSVGLSKGETAASRAFREWIRKNKP